MIESSNTPIVTFEGGLGSQLLALIEALHLRDQSIAFEVNLSYFYPEELPKHMIQRPWRLDRYGYDISSISRLGVGKRKSVLPLRKSQMSDWEFARNIPISAIPLNEGAVASLLSTIGIHTSSDFSLVHLRRGDYLSVSSKVVSDSEVAEVLFKYQKMLDQDVIVVSDSKITLKKNRLFKELEGKSGRSFHFLEGTDFDEGVIHDLMRKSNFLVCSNSTFSFTAALLSEKGTCAIAPMEFFDPMTMFEVNKRFRSAGNFFLFN